MKYAKGCVAQFVFLIGLRFSDETARLRNLRSKSQIAQFCAPESVRAVKISLVCHCKTKRYSIPFFILKSAVRLVRKHQFYPY